MNEFYKNKKVLITGHTGFKGAWLTQVLLQFGAEVIGVSLRPTTTPNLFDVLGLEHKVKNYFADIRDEEAMLAIFNNEKPEIVLHLAAQPIVRTSYDDPVGTLSTNVMGTIHILEAVRKTKSARAVVIITTDKVYENKELGNAFAEHDALGGHDPYSASKAAADIVTQSYTQSFFNPNDFGVKHDTLIAVARAGNVVGGGDWADYRLIPDVVRAIYHDNKDVEIRNPDSVRPWQHVVEPLLGYLTLARGMYEKDVSYSGAWNFGPFSDSFVTVGEVLNEAQKESISFKYTVIPDSSKHEAGVLMLDITKATTYLPWKPKLTFPETTKLTFDWYKNYYEKTVDVVEFTNNQINIFFR